MRELEFRAWDKKDERYLSQDAFVITSKGKCIFFMIHQGGEMTEYDWSEKTIIEQYTGLKDKHGTKIFEGDVVRYFEKGVGLYPYDAKFPDAKNAVNDTDRIGIITLNPECRIGTMMITNNDSNKIEIIGNIHTHNQDGTLK